MRAHQAFFERLAEEWDAAQSPARQERLRQLLSRFDNVWKESPLILDVGTGTGALLPLLRERAALTPIVAMDFAYAMLQRARERERFALMAQADVHHLPFPARTFGAIICHSSFPHFADKPAALSELKRTLRIGGRLIVMHDICRERVNAIHRSSAVTRCDLLPTGAEMEQMLLQAGFCEVQVQDCQAHFLAVGVSHV
jgi:demethylmenaquinone methyltransferase/2-methoxy-6-polyprenyl-1,4-benzoquinol methylase